MPQDRARILISAEDKTREAFTSVQRNIGQLQSSAAQLGGIFARLGAGLSLAGVAASIRSVVNTADEMGKLAQRTGVAVEEFSKLDYAAKLSDVSREELTKGLAQLSKRLLEAADGSKEARDAFARIDIDPTQFSSADQVLKVIADRFKRLPDGAVKTATAMQLLGKSGALLIPLLNSGADGLKALGDEAQRAGVVISTETAKAAEEFNDNITRLGANLEGIKNNVIGPLLPTLNELSRSLATAGRDAGQSTGGFNILKVALEAIAILGANVSFVFDGVGRSIGAAVAQASALVRGNLAEYRAILKELAADDQRARKALDDFERRILNPSATAVNKPTGAAPSIGDAVSKTISTTRAKTDPLLAEAKRVFEATRNESEKLTAELAKLDTLLARGYVNWDTYSRAVFDAQAKIDGTAQAAKELIDVFDNLSYKTADSGVAAFIREQQQEINDLNRELAEDAARAQEDAQRKIQDEIKKSGEFAKEFGLTFTSAMEDAIVSGKSFSDVLKGLEQDIARIIIRRSITEPLGNSVSKFIGSFDFGSLFGFADGGIMTGAGPLPLRKYASGGVANSAQLAVFGEGSRPEAFVPLPDGRSIPVKMQGAGGVVVNVTQNIDSRSDQATIRASMALAIQTAQAQIIDSINRGGKFARAVGKA